MEQAEEPTVAPWAAAVSMVARRVVVELQVTRTVVGTMVVVGAVVAGVMVAARRAGAGRAEASQAARGAACWEVGLRAAAAEVLMAE